MKLTDLNPRWIGSGGEGISRKNPQTGVDEPVPFRPDVYIGFNCPCGCGRDVAIQIENPIDGKGPLTENHPKWKREGDDFATLTLTPSIRRMQIQGRGCQWHGFVTKGEIVHCGDARNDKGEQVS